MATIGRETPTESDQVDPIPSPLAKLLAGGLILAVLIYVCWKATLETPALLKWNAYGLSEWLINYEGGFVRRGLVGQWIKIRTQGGAAVGLVNALVFWNFTALCGLLLCLVVLSRPIGWLKAVMLLLLPGSVYTMMVGNEFFFRKEILFEAYLCAVAVAFISAQRISAPALSRLFEYFAAALIIGGSAALPLVHESFLFTVAVPTAVIVFWMACRRSLKAGQIAVLAYLAFVSLEFLALVVFKGTEATRDMIWASLHAGDKAVLSLDGQVSGAIEMLGYSVTALLRMPLGIVSSGSVWYWVFTIVASCAYLIVLSLGQQPRDSEVRHRIPWVFTVYALCFAASVPLLCLGGDWGRWIAAVNVAVAILICAGEYRQPLPVCAATDSTVGERL